MISSKQSNILNENKEKGALILENLRKKRVEFNQKIKVESESGHDIIYTEKNLNISPLKLRTKESNMMITNSELFNTEENHQPKNGIQPNLIVYENTNTIPSDQNNIEESFFTSKERKIAKQNLDHIRNLNKDNTPLIRILNSDDNKLIEAKLNHQSNVKQRKGDMTPNSNLTDNAVIRKKTENFEEIKSENMLVRKFTQEESFQANQPIICQNNEIIVEHNPDNKVKNEEVELNENLKNLNQASEKTQRYSSSKNLKLNSKYLANDFENLKVGKEAHFIERMFFDIFKRRTKNDRIEEILKSRQKKIPEKDIVQTFNRLILDSNRRMEVARETSELNKKEQSLLLCKSQNCKKISKTEFSVFYNERFVIKEEERKSRLKKERDIKELERKIIEDKFLSSSKNKKYSKKEIDGVLKRFTDETLKWEASKGIRSYREKSIMDLKAKSSSPITNRVISPVQYRFDNDEISMKGSNNINLNSEFLIENERKVKYDENNSRNSTSRPRSKLKNLEIKRKKIHHEFVKSHIDNRLNFQVKNKKMRIKVKKSISSLDDYFKKNLEDHRIAPRPINSRFDQGSLISIKINDFKSSRIKETTKKQQKFVPEFLTHSVVDEILKKKNF